ncbi:uncharacterized protein [Procambarus clarkii]|uniref:uncharacterized protein isoform X1 n=1 Tax=Procambarus clarkii TaxID=6728 RepID=UPI001E675702|nr:uncharacterized protein LOC123745681 isoform X1 [Procambarus clarkii]
MCDMPENCAICKDKFDELLRRPRNLPCGHIICSVCTRAIALKGLFFCPSCHPERSVAADAQLPVKSAEAIITKQTDIRPTSVAPESVEPKDSPRRDDKILQSMVEQQKLRLNTCIIRCNRPLSNLGKHHVLLRDSRIKHYRLEAGLSSLLEQNNAAIRLLELELKRVADMATVGQEIRRQLQELMVRLNTVDTVNNAREVYVIMDGIDKYKRSLKKWGRKCQELCWNSRAIFFSIKRLEKAKASLKATSEKQAAVAPVNQEETTVAPVNLDDSSSSNESEDQSADEDFFGTMLTFSIEYLRKISRPLQSLFLSGRVFSVKEFHGGFYSARITLRGEAVYFHALEKRPPNACPDTIKDRAMLQLLDHCATVAYDFIECDTATVEQVEICTSPDTALSKQFVSLHTGEVHQAGDSEEHGVYVVVGEYDKLSNKDTHDPRPTVEGQYEKPAMDWDVNAWVRPDTGNWVQFGIMLDCCMSSDNSSDVPGGAVGDQGALKAGAQATDVIESVELDCGIVLPF